MHFDMWQSSVHSKAHVRAAVKLQGLIIKSSDTEGRAPKQVKLFTNRASLGFSEAADFPPVQEFDFSEKEVQEGKILPLKCVVLKPPLSVNLSTIWVGLVGFTSC